MKRRSWISILFGGAAAAQVKMPTESGCSNPRMTNPIPTCRKVANNECPVCGTLAKPYERPRGLGHYGQCDPPVPNVACIKSNGDPYGPKEVITRCANCNNAFWQDATE